MCTCLFFIKLSNASVYREFMAMVDNSYPSNGFSIWIVSLSSVAKTTLAMLPIYTRKC